MSSPTVETHANDLPRSGEAPRHRLLATAALHDVPPLILARFMAVAATVLVAWARRWDVWKRLRRHTA